MYFISVKVMLKKIYKVLKLFKVLRTPYIK